MISPFGVDHGDISKSYTKMAPKLAGALKSFDPAKSTNLSMKLRHHAGAARLNAGVSGQQMGSLNRGFMREESQADAGRAKMLNNTVSRMGQRKRMLP